MLTHCPNCSAALEVTEEILSVANGKVRCGDCGSVFDGYEFLEKTEDDVAPVLTPSTPEAPKPTLEAESDAHIDEGLTPEQSQQMINDLDSLEAELSFLNDSFEASSLHIDKVAENTPTQEVTAPEEEPPAPKIDVSFKATSPEPAPKEKPAPHTRDTAARIDIDLSKRIEGVPSSSEQTSTPKTPTPKKSPTPEPASPLPEIDLEVDGTKDESESFGLENSEISSGSSIDDIINQFMDEHQKEQAESSKEIDPDTSHAMDIDEMMAKSGIIVDADDQNDPFNALVNNSQEDTTPRDNTLLPPQQTKESTSAEDTLQELFPEATPEIDELTLTRKASDASLNDTGALISQKPADLKIKKQKTKQPQSKTWRTVGTIGCLILVLGLISQSLYATRYTLADNPTTSDLAVQTCKYIPFCELRNPKAYTLISRALTPHPVLKDIQVLDITLKNTAKFEQPLPYVFVSMTDQMGKQVATNTFKNSEYEEDNVWVKAGEERTIQILFKTPNSRARNFEIDFQ